MSVTLMKAGAVDFLPKLFRDEDFLGSIARALAEDRRSNEQEGELLSLRGRFKSLTQREREALQLASSGLLNKIASQLGLSAIIVELHRGRATQKMKARTLAQAVRMMEALERGARQVQTPA